MLRPKAIWFSLALAVAAIPICHSAWLSVSGPLPAVAHEVKIDEDVGGTLHIEPNDTPRAGEEVLAWVALRSRGGEIIELKECDCQFAVYAGPRSAEADPLLTPELAAVEGDGIQGIPGAEFTFPSVGLYTLVMTGSPKQSTDFTPFELAFDVTVAAGSAAEAPTATVPPPESDAAASSEVATEDGVDEAAATGEAGAEEVATEPARRPILLLFIGGMVMGAVAVLVIRRS